MSLGRLNLYVQNAINKGIMRYQRTLLIGNNTEIDNINASDESQNEHTILKLKKVQSAIIEIL